MVAIALLLVSLAASASAIRPPRFAPFDEHENRLYASNGVVNARVAPANTSFYLRIALKSSNADGLHAALMDVSTPGGAKYGQRLTKEQVQEFLKPAQGAAEAVQSFLTSNGINSSVIAPAGDWLGFNASVQQANSLFGANFSLSMPLDTGVNAIRAPKGSVPQSLQSYIDFVYPTVAIYNPHGGLPVCTPPLRLINGTNERCPTAAVASSGSLTIRSACPQTRYATPTAAASGSSKTFLGDFRTKISGTSSTGGSSSQVLIPCPEARTADVSTGAPAKCISLSGDYQDSKLEGLVDTFNALLEEDSPQVIAASHGNNEGNMSTFIANKLCDAYAQIIYQSAPIRSGPGCAGTSGSQCSSCSKIITTFPSGCPYMVSASASIRTNPRIPADYLSRPFSMIPKPPAKTSKPRLVVGRVYEIAAGITFDFAPTPRRRKYGADATPAPFAPALTPFATASSSSVPTKAPSDISPSSST
ncbi:hypothetical protein PLICRDRAFT_176799 [Plicaturopsis crispa FD-325 SS-3]|nr:hypothetical protein PLICRDRAFT_176799 [Plicaturopsis crispa FD-325 SS-3]